MKKMSQKLTKQMMTTSANVEQSGNIQEISPDKIHEVVDSILTNVCGKDYSGYAMDTDDTNKVVKYNKYAKDIARCIMDASICTRLECEPFIQWTNLAKESLNHLTEIADGKDDNDIKTLIKLVNNVIAIANKANPDNIMKIMKFKSIDEIADIILSYIIVTFSDTVLEDYMSHEKKGKEKLSL